MTRRTTAIARLEQHPNLDEVLGVLARLAHVNDADLPRLAAAWTNDAFLASARDRALSPDSPLVCEVLSAFDAVSALFADDLRGEQPYVTVPPPVVVVALKAVRDALAGAYARPALSRAEHAALLRPWRAVYAEGEVTEPDLGPQSAEVKALLQALPRLATRCHDAEGLALWEGLVDQTFVAEADRAAQNLLLGAIAAISIFVGGIGVMNIMFITVRERTREIGIRAATGASMRDILTQFLTEAVVLSTLGGIAGLALAGGVGAVAAWGFGMPVVFSVTVTLGALAGATLMGAGFGLVPAIRAARLSPVEALASP